MRRCHHRRWQRHLVIAQQINWHKILFYHHVYIWMCAVSKKPRFTFRHASPPSSTMSSTFSSYHTTPFFKNNVKNSMVCQMHIQTISDRVSHQYVSVCGRVMAVSGENRRRARAEQKLMVTVMRACKPHSCGVELIVDDDVTHVGT
jgi:hypothetical protein